MRRADLHDDEVTAAVEADAGRRSPFADRDEDVRGFLYDVVTPSGAQ